MKMPSIGSFTLWTGFILTMVFAVLLIKAIVSGPKQLPDTLHLHDTFYMSYSPWVLLAPLLGALLMLVSGWLIRSSEASAERAVRKPPELAACQSDLEAWGREAAETLERTGENLSSSDAVRRRFREHLELLEPLADTGDLDAAYAMSSIYLYGLIYPDEGGSEQERREGNDRMTSLLFKCARGGQVYAFDNLVTCGTGSIGEAARLAAADYKRGHKPEWCEDHRMPMYTEEWMEGAMNLWITSISNNNGEEGCAPDHSHGCSF